MLIDAPPLINSSMTFFVPIVRVHRENYHNNKLLFETTESSPKKKATKKFENSHENSAINLLHSFI